jgi:hypothetical protein
MLEQIKLIRLIEETVDLIERREKEITRPEEKETTPQPAGKGEQGQTLEK